MRHANPWTDEDDAVLRAGVARGYTFEVLATLTKRSRSAVAGRVSRLGLLRQPTAKPETSGSRIPLKKLDVVRGGSQRRDRGKTNTRPAALPRDHGLPHLTTMQGQRLHVYPPDPYAREPLATYERHGDWWVRRDDPNIKFRTTRDAVGAVSP